MAEEKEGEPIPVADPTRPGKSMSDPIDPNAGDDDDKDTVYTQNIDEEKLDAVDSVEAGDDGGVVDSLTTADLARGEDVHEDEADEYEGDTDSEIEGDDDEVDVNEDDEDDED